MAKTDFINHIYLTHRSFSKSQLWININIEYALNFQVDASYQIPATWVRKKWSFYALIVETMAYVNISDTWSIFFV